MRKDYVKPEGNVVALQMDENIALSFGFIDVIHEFTLAYRVVGSQKYIKDTNIPSRGLSGVTGATLDAFYLIDAIMDGLHGRGDVVTGWENCNANPDVATYSF
jgi:hypothetical protein